MAVKKKPSILFLVSLPPPFYGSSIMNQFIKESRQINEFVNATYINTGLSPGIADSGKISILKILKFFSLVKKLICTLSNNTFDSIYVAPAVTGKPFFKDSLLILIVKLFNDNLLIHLHGKGINSEVERSGFKRWYYSLVFRRANIVCLSELLTQDIDKINSIDKVYVLNNGIPPISKGKKTMSSPVTRILFIGIFREEKGPLVLLKAIRPLLDEPDNFEVLFVGELYDKKFRKKFLHYYNSINWDGKVKLHKAAYGNSKSKIFQASDILVFPSYFQNDAFPLVILEAMSCGLAIIASKVGAIPEIIQDGINGILFNINDNKAFANALKHLIADKEARNKLGIEAQKTYYTKYTLREFEKGFISILNNEFVTY